MTNKLKNFIIFFAVIGLVIIGLVFKTYVFADSIYPITSFDGPGPAYNGLIIDTATGSTTWCKPGDRIDVLEGAHIQQSIHTIPDADWVGKSFLGLENLETLSTSEYELDEKRNEVPDTNQYKPTITPTTPASDVNFAGSRISVEPDPSNPTSYSKFGFLYWMQFNTDKQEYYGFGNAEQANESFYNNYTGTDPTQWQKGIDIKTDADKPTITVDSPSTTPSSGPLTVNIKADDNGGCGVQQIQYAIKGPGDSDYEAVQTANPYTHSDPTVYDGTKFTEYDGTAMDSNTKIGGNAQHFPSELPGIEETFSTSVTFDTPGTYELEVESTDNLGNGNGDWKDYGSYVIGTTVVTPTPPVVTPKAPIATITAPATMEIGDGFGVAGTGTDPQNETLTYTWTETYGGTLSGNSGNLVMGDNPIIVTLYVTDTDGLSSPTVSATINPIDSSPSVTLTLPATIALGDDLYVQANGSTPQSDTGDKLTYTWSTPSDMQGTITNDNGTVYFINKSDVGQTKTFTVTVRNQYGETASATASTKVVEPQPTVSIATTGTLKDNRTVTVADTADGGSKRFPIDPTKTQWSFFGSSGNAISVTNTADSGLIESLDGTTGISSMDSLFSTAGTYTAKCTVYNTLGDTATTSQTINIVADQLPSAIFTSPKTVYRDPNNDDRATFTLNDKSSSPDGDTIDKRIWLYAFDSNNDGNYEDETWYIYENGTWTTYGTYADVIALIANATAINALNSGNLTTVTLTPTNFDNGTGQLQSHVGVYDFVEIVRESYGQPTIPSLVTVKDYKTATTLN